MCMSKSPACKHHVRFITQHNPRHVYVYAWSSLRLAFFNMALMNCQLAYFPDFWLHTKFLNVIFVC